MLELSSNVLAGMLYGNVRITNADGYEATGKNTVVYHGGDIIAKLLGGDVAYKISHFYLEYQNTAGAPVPLANSRSVTAASVKAYLTSDKDLLRAQLSATPTYSASDVNHVNNQVAFTAVSTATTGALNSLAFSAGTNSKVMAACLIAAPTGAIGGDVLYARWILGTVVPAVGAGQIAATWTAGAV